MDARDKIIVALDVDSPEKALTLVQQLTPYVGCFKIGLEFINSMFAEFIIPGEAIANQNLKKIRELFDELKGKIFWDGKLNDIPNTVLGAARSISKMGVKMFNVHCLSGFEALKKARDAAAEVGGDKKPLVLGVTILTSLNYGDLVKMGVRLPINFADENEQKATEKREIQGLVKELALMAEEVGLDGVICSPEEIQLLRECCQPEFLIVTPGVRPRWASAGDQKRIMTPREAIEAGADYLVIGRPITNPPKEAVSQPVDAAIFVKDEIEVALKKREKSRKNYTKQEVKND